MSIRHLDYLFRPRSIAVIGASGKPATVGATLMRNLLDGGYSRPIMPVNPGYESVAGVMTYPDVASLPKVPDLAIICTPPATVPRLITDLGERGTRAAVVVTAGLGDVPEGELKSLQQQMIEAARPHLMRILGPNCVGILIPGLGINASFAHTAALPGKIAFVTQSGGMVTAVLDWANTRDIGFSHFVSLGNSADVDFGDVLDYLASEPQTRSILLYIESITDARKFMSAARAAARIKPVIVVKAGRAPEGARAAASHTGALAGADDVYDAAIRRAGMLRVDEIEDLFFAVETLARAKSLHGERMVIMTNGGGPGVMATDSLARRGGHVATLSAETLQRLDAVLPAMWSYGNPVDIIGDAPVERYVETLKVLLERPEVDALLFVHAPSAIVPSEQIAEAVAQAVEAIERRVRELQTGARLDGFSVQKMARRPGGHELIIGVATDPVFGPVILFGQGGVAVEVIGDRAVALPPLNAHLARELVSRTRVSRLLAGYRNLPAAHRDSINTALVQISRLVADVAEINELDINPLLADEHGIIALDARIRVQASELPGPVRLAIRPYPKELEEVVKFQELTLLLRPIRPEDEPAHHDLFSKLKPEDIRFRFFRAVRELPRSDYARYTQIDYNREMAFIATRKDMQGRPETLGVVRAVADPDNASAEFAIVIRSDLKGQGLGSLLMDKMIRYCRDRGIGQLIGEVLKENRGMQALARRFGFVVSPGVDKEVRALSLDLA